MDSPRALRQRLTFVLRATLFALLALSIVTPLLMGVSFMAVLTRPGCGGEVVPPMPYESVTFRSREFDAPTPAYFIPGRGVATVIVIPTGSAGRGDRMPEIAVYHAAGFNVLTYSSRVCIGNGSANTLGYKEAQQVGDALTYLSSRTDIDGIAVHGFSAGGAAAVMAAAQFPSIQAVVAEGGYHDFAAEVDADAPNTLWFAPLFRLGVRLGYRLTTGNDLSILSPVSVIGQIAPRPILLIYGTNEPGLPGARLQLAAAGSNAQLWEVPGAGHGNYSDVAGDEYRERVSDFMKQALK